MGFCPSWCLPGFPERRGIAADFPFALTADSETISPEGMNTVVDGMLKRMPRSDRCRTVPSRKAYEVSIRTGTPSGWVPVVSGGKSWARTLIANNEIGRAHV